MVLVTTFNCGATHEHAIRQKTEIMVDHFHEQVIARKKIGGQARAMVVTNGVARAIQYFHAFRDYLKECKSPYRAIVAFSGEHEYEGRKVRSCFKILAEVTPVS
jgi:type I restriction enzyme R subunit